MKNVVCFLCVSVFVFGGLLAKTTSAQPALDELERQLDRILSGRRLPPVTPAPRELEVAPRESAAGFLGLTADKSETRDLVQIISVDKDGPAEKAGLKAGDFVLTVNRRAIRSLDDMAAALQRLAAGDKADFEVFRDGRSEVLQVTLGRRPVAGPAADDEPRAEELPAPRADERKAGLGIRVVNLTDETRRRYGLSVRRGAAVSEVYDGWPADIAGIAVGDVIVSADDRRVDAADDLVAYLRTIGESAAVDLAFYRGDRLFTTTARLGDIVEAPPRIADPEPPRESEPRIFGEDRPALRKIEGVIGRLTAPDRESRAEVATLKHEVELLRQQVKLLEQKVQELEKRLTREAP